MDLIRGMLFLSRGRVWGCRSGPGAVFGKGITAQGSLSEHLGTGSSAGAGTHSCKIFLTWPPPGHWGLCTGTKLRKVKFPWGGGSKERAHLLQQGQQSLWISVHLSVSCTLWRPLTQCNDSCSLKVGFFYQDKLPVTAKQAAIMCSVWGCCLW